MVYYRKYRPQKISDLDSSTVRETLQSVLKKNVPHAFLFTGPKGLGKTSTARIVAKAVNCTEMRNEKGEMRNNHREKTNQKEKISQLSSLNSHLIEPCNECEQCVSITSGTNLDVLEIDAASNRGIDEIRDLKEKIRLAPVSSKMKVYIIDEVHMLTTEAFNALLKTLEEPPAHAMFVLATTEPHKVPATINSRCFHINFNLATDKEIVRSLKRVVEGEKLQVDDEALVAIAKMAEGGFRDAVKLLEELVLLAGDQRITKESFEKSYKNASTYSHVANLLASLKNRDVTASLEIVKTVVSQGGDIKYFIAQVTADLHKKLLSKLGVEKTSENELPEFEIHEIKALVELLGRAYQETKYAVVPQLPLELAIIEWCTSESHPNPLLKGEGTDSAPFEGDEDGVTVSSMRKQIGTMKKVQALYGAPKKAEKDEEVAIKTTTVELMHTPGNGEITKEWLDAFWRSLITEMKNHNHTAAGVLRSCSIKSYDKEKLIIVAAYPFHKERLEEFKTKDALVAVCKMLTGKTIEVAIELKR